MSQRASVVEQPRFSYWPSPYLRPAELLELVNIASDAGFAGVYMSDHLLPPRGAPDRRINELWTTLAMVAAAHPRLDVGALVACADFRPPAVTYRAAATLAAMGSARVHVGVGAGWYRPEYHFAGLRFHNHSDRLQRLEEYLRVLQLLVTGSTSTFAGAHFSLPGNHITFQALPQVSLLVGGQSSGIARLARRLGVAWNAWSAPAPRGMSARDGIPQSVQFLVVPDDRPLDLDRDELAAHPSLTGPWSTIAREIAHLHEQGVQEIVVPDYHFSFLDDRRAFLGRFGSEVIEATR